MKKVLAIISFLTLFSSTAKMTEREKGIEDAIKKNLPTAVIGGKTLKYKSFKTVYTDKAGNEEIVEIEINYGGKKQTRTLLFFGGLLAGEQEGSMREEFKKAHKKKK